MWWELKFYLGPARHSFSNFHLQGKHVKEKHKKSRAKTLTIHHSNINYIFTIFKKISVLDINLALFQTKCYKLFLLLAGLSGDLAKLFGKAKVEWVSIFKLGHFHQTFCFWVHWHFWFFFFSFHDFWTGHSPASQSTRFNLIILI